MFERFTESAIKVIMVAQEESRRLGHDYVGTEMLLLGLVHDRRTIAGEALHSVGLTVRTTRVEVEHLIGRGNGAMAVEIPFTPHAKGALEASWTAARDFKHTYIGTEHLLLGLITDKESTTAMEVFQNMHVDTKDLRCLVGQIINNRTEPKEYAPRKAGEPTIHPLRIKGVVDLLDGFGNMLNVFCKTLDDEQMSAEAKTGLDDTAVREEWVAIERELSRLEQVVGYYSATMLPKITESREKIRRLTSQD